MRYNCPCCGYLVFDEKPGSYLICPVCCWEDDPVQFKDPDFEGGANDVSLRQARRNFIRFKASDSRFINRVRSPTKLEANSRVFKPLS